MAATIMSRVLKGIALLDKKGPEDWRTKISIENLNMGSGDDCIIGQLYDSYAHSINELGVDIGFNHGFDAEGGTGHTRQTIYYKRLTKVWKKALSKPAAIDAVLVSRVQKGIALLDKKGPEDWREKVNLDTLDMIHGTNCIVGQIYGGYFEACRILKIPQTGGAIGCLYGFNIETLQDDPHTSNKKYKKLGEIWSQELSKPVPVVNPWQIIKKTQVESAPIDHVRKEINDLILKDPLHVVKLYQAYLGDIGKVSYNAEKGTIEVTSG